MVLVSAILASALCVVSLWFALNSDRAEKARGHPPWWAWVGIVAFISLWGSLALWWNANPFMETFAACFLGCYLGGGATFLALRLLSRRFNGR